MTRIYQKDLIRIYTSKDNESVTRSYKTYWSNREAIGMGCKALHIVYIYIAGSSPGTYVLSIYMAG